MLFEYNGSKIYYKFYHGKSSVPIILLHGWGCDSKIFKNLIEAFPDKYFLVVDLPPFGKSEKNIVDWSIFTYVGMLMSLCEHLNIKKCILCAHSFGGRISLILSAIDCSLVQSCILISSAGLKPKRTFSYHLKVIKFKFYKFLGLNTTGLGSADYLALSPKMKKIFINIINTHLDDYSKKINIPCLIIWGENDSETPIYMARRLNKNIKNSKLVVVKNSGHFVFLDKPFEVYSEIQRFLEDK